MQSIKKENLNLQMACNNLREIFSFCYQRKKKKIPLTLNDNKTCMDSVISNNKNIDILDNYEKDNKKTKKKVRKDEVISDIKEIKKDMGRSRRKESSIEEIEDKLKKVKLKNNKKILEKNNKKVLEKNNKKVLEKNNKKILEKNNKKVLKKNNKKVLDKKENEVIKNIKLKKKGREVRNLDIDSHSSENNNSNDDNSKEESSVADLYDEKTDSEIEPHSSEDIYSDESDKQLEDIDYLEKRRIPKKIEKDTLDMKPSRSVSKKPNTVKFKDYKQNEMFDIASIDKNTKYEIESDSEICFKTNKTQEKLFNEELKRKILQVLKKCKEG